MWKPWVCANAPSHLCLQYVDHFKHRHWLAVHWVQTDSVPSPRRCFGGLRPTDKAP